LKQFGYLAFATPQKETALHRNIQPVKPKASSVTSNMSRQQRESSFKFLAATGFTPQTEDPSNKLLDVETQLQWLRQIGFVDVDCNWKSLELGFLVGVKP